MLADVVLSPSLSCSYFGGMSLCFGLLHALLHSPIALWLLGQVLCMSSSIHAQYDLCTDRGHDVFALQILQEPDAFRDHATPEDEALFKRARAACLQMWQQAHDAAKSEHSNGINMPARDHG